MRYFTRFFEYFSDNADLFELILVKDYIPGARKYFHNLAIFNWQRKVIVFLDDDSLTEKELFKREVVNNYIAGAHIRLLEFWLENIPLKSPKYMAKQWYDITWSLLKMKNKELIDKRNLDEIDR